MKKYFILITFILVAVFAMAQERTVNSSKTTLEMVLPLNIKVLPLILSKKQIKIQLIMSSTTIIILKFQKFLS